MTLICSATLGSVARALPVDGAVVSFGLPVSAKVIVMPALAGPAGVGAGPDGVQTKAQAPPIEVSPARVQARAAHSQAPIAPAPRMNWVEVSAVGLSLPVGDYRDCHGDAPLTRATVARDWCAPPDTPVLVAHNPGLFTPLLGAHVGDVAGYWDGHGTLREYRIKRVSRAPSQQAWPVVTEDPSDLVLVTCATPDGSVDWIFQAVPI